jgi:hypothetical protein
VARRIAVVVEPFLTAVFDPFEWIANGYRCLAAWLCDPDNRPVSTIEVNDRIFAKVEAMGIVSKVGTHSSGSIAAHGGG